MAEYDEIHKSEATPVKVGVDLPGLIAACGIADGAQESFPSGHDDSEETEIGLVSWKLYWDDATSAYNLYEPKVVVPGGGVITATGATGLTDADTYYCRVDKSGDTYTATVVTSSTATENTVTVVPICEITAAGATQFHTGVINCTLPKKTLTYTGTDGVQHTANVLASEDISIRDGGGGGGAIANVIGSDYVDVDDKTVTEGGVQVAKRQVKAKILTGATASETADAHALLTHDTVQKVVAKKVFTGPAAGAPTIEIDGPNGRVAISNGTKSITLDLDDIPNGCAGALKVRELSYVDNLGNTQTYHGLFCDDVDLPEIVQKSILAGDGIQVTVSGNVITITNTRGSGGGGGASTSGFTGSKSVVTDVTYDESTHQLLKKVETWTYENGLLKSVTVPDAMTEITQAVEETV